MDTRELMGKALDQIEREVKTTTLKESEPLSKCAECGKDVEPPRYKTDIREEIKIKDEVSPGLGTSFRVFKKGDVVTQFEFEIMKRNAANRDLPIPEVEKCRVERKRNEYAVYVSEIRCADCAYNWWGREKDRCSQMTIRIPFKFEAEKFPLEDGFKKFVPRGERGRGVFLHGTAGTGKTTAAIGIMREWFNQRMGFSVPYGPEHFSSEWRFVNYPTWIIALQGSYRNENKRDETADEMISALTSVHFLIIDDIGAEKMTDFVRQTTYAIINEREMEMRPTFITSNFSLQELNEHIDSRVASRIAGMCEVVELKGRDRRIKR
jgi:DNA replication protein DnaC